MLRNYLAAALRNFARSYVYAIISVACLSIGLAATFLAAAYMDHLHSYNRWIAGHQLVYRVAIEYTLPGAAPIDLETTPQDVAPWVALNVEQVADAASIVMSRGAVRRGDVEAYEDIAWADKNVFRVLRVPTYLGNLESALQQPDSLVLTRSLARKYFGTDQVLGQTLQVDRQQPMVIKAVIEDLPPNTKLAGDDTIVMFAAASSPFAPQSQTPTSWVAYSYFRLGADVPPERLNAQLARYRREGSSVEVRLSASRLDRLVYSSDRRAVFYAMPVLASLVLLISCMNFVNLTTARAIRRSTEVGVRKAAGASRGNLIAQFMGEALIFNGLGMLLALSLCELSMPVARILLDVPMTFEYWRSMPLLLTITGITLATAALSGFYPAVLLARFNPASILNGGKSRAGQTRGLRQALVVFQLAVLAALVTSVIVAGQQLDHLLQKSLRFDGERMLMISSSCRQALVEELRKVPGVAGVACSESAPLNQRTNHMVARLANGTRQSFEGVRIGVGFLELYGLRPLAGRFFRSDVPADVLGGQAQRVQRVVINATAVREFGFESAQAAIGRDPFPGADVSMQVIGVVEDFRLGRFDQPMSPMVYLAEPGRAQLLSVKMVGDGVAGSLGQIDELWKELGDPKPIDRFFLSDSIENMHRSIVRQRWIFSAFAVLAVSLGLIGMLGLASSAAQERQLEIAIRKAFGAHVSDVVRLILWRFIKLAALAGLSGCLLAGPLMSRWLQRFEDRIDLQPWVFVGTCLLIVGVAVVTVCVHAVLMARARPAEALR